MENKDAFIKNKSKLNKTELLEEYFLVASSNEVLLKRENEIKLDKERQTQLKLDLEKEINDKNILKKEADKVPDLEKEISDLKELNKKMLRELEELKSIDNSKVINEKDNTINRLGKELEEMGQILSQFIDSTETSLKLNQTTNDMMINTFSILKDNIIKKWGNK